MERRSFLRTLRSTFAGATAYFLASRNTEARPAGGAGVRVNEPAPVGSIDDSALSFQAGHVFAGAPASL